MLTVKEIGILIRMMYEDQTRNVELEWLAEALDRKLSRRQSYAL